jgi:uncharacterized protein YjbI with pentapeptide repeats/very-short-patch-repair endonuclease
MDTKELLKHYEAGERDFSSSFFLRNNLTSANLSGTNLSEANLSSAFLLAAKLSGANLSRANLSGAYLLGAKLSRANLSGAYLLGAKLSEANLERADLSRADLSEANLSRAKLSRAKLNGANLGRANLSRTDLREANLSTAYLGIADLSGADLSGADLSEANLSEANLRGADLSQTKVSRVYLCRTNLSGADLSGADLSGVHLSGANLSGANLSRANLSGANLSEANLSKADLSEANLIKADLSKADLSEANLIGANLFNTDLTNTNLSEASLYGTILAYEKISEDLQQENKDLKEKLSLLEIQFENLVEKQVERRLINNQGIKAKKSTWEGLRFRSEPERLIAKTLDEMGIMFFPLPSGRVMTEEGMKTREVDFLICSQGLWGILECDGEMWHPSAAKDHKRDNDYKRHGLWFIQRFTGKECKAHPDKVVQQFLDMLHKFHEDQCYLIRGNSTRTNTSLLPTTSSLSSEDLSFENNSDLPNSLAKSFDEKLNNESLNESLSLEDIPTERDASSILMSISSTLSRLVEDTRGSRGSGNLG